MGEIRTKVLLQNAGDLFLLEQGRLRKGKVRSAEVEVLVDTGAVLTLLPQDLVEKLGFRKIGKAIVALADEQKVELDKVGDVFLTIAGRSMTPGCLVGPPGCEPLIGQIVLEELDLLLDPLKKTITPRPESPYLPTLKLK